MASLIRMPQKGLSEDSAILSKWYVKEGDAVKTGDYLFAIETGKATFDVEAEADGTVLKTVGEEGDEVPVKKIVCVVGTPGEAYQLDEDSAPAAVVPAAAPVSAAPAASAAAASVEDEGDATFIRMPQKGLSEESAILSQWFVKKGDTVKTGDPLFSIETGKATFDVESEADGIVLETIGAEGDEIVIRKVVCVVGPQGARYSLGGDNPVAAAAEAPAAAPVVQAAVIAAPAAAPAAGKIKISRRAKAMAESKNIDYRFAVPTGPEGRIIQRDIEAMLQTGPFITDAARSFATGSEQGTGLSGAITTADLGSKAAAAAVPAAKAEAAAAPAAEAEYEVVRNSNLRKIIAKNMHNSLATMAQLTHNASADATVIQNYRARVKEAGAGAGVGNISLNDIAMYAVAHTLLDFPELNAHYSDEEMKLFRTVHLGFAVDTPRGLLVPTIRNAEKLSLEELSRQAKELAAACQSGSIDPSLLSGATFTVSNLGAYGITSFTPIINPPQTGILGICNIEYKVRMKNGQPEFYPALGLSLTYDHRATDGAPASRFLQTLCRNIENFDLLLAK